MFSKYDLKDPFTIKVFKFSDKIKKSDLEEYKKSFEESLLCADFDITGGCSWIHCRYSVPNFGQSFHYARRKSIPLI